MSHANPAPTLKLLRISMLFLMLSAYLAAPAFGMGRDAQPEDGEEGAALLLIVAETLLTLNIEPFVLIWLARVRFGYRLPSSTAYLAMLLALLQVLFLAGIALCLGGDVIDLTVQLIGWSPSIANALLALHCVGFLVVHQGLVLLAVSRLAAPLEPAVGQWLQLRSWWLLLAPLVLLVWLGMVMLYSHSQRHLVYPGQLRLAALALFVLAVLVVGRRLGGVE